MSYQLQLPQDVTPEDLEREIVRRAWMGLAGAEPAGAVRPEIAAAMERAVRAVLARRLYVYDTCGLHRSCFDGARPAAWNTRSAAGPGLRERQAVRLLHVHAPDGLAGLAAELGAALLDASGLKPAAHARALELRTLLEGAVTAAVGPYLFIGDLCETESHLRVAAAGTVFGRETAG